MWRDAEGITKELGNEDHSFATNLVLLLNLLVPAGSTFILLLVDLSRLLHQPPHPQIHRDKSGACLNVSVLPFSLPGSLVNVQILEFIVWVLATQYTGR